LALILIAMLAAAPGSTEAQTPQAQRDAAVLDVFEDALKNTSSFARQ
jgi:hypothetical protein